MRSHIVGAQPVLVGGEEYAELIDEYATGLEVETGAAPPTMRQLPAAQLRAPVLQRVVAPQQFAYHPVAMPAPQYAPPPQPAPQQQVVQPELNAPRARVYYKPETEVRNFPIGLSRAGVVGGAIIDIESKPQCLFKGKRLSVNDKIAEFFEILDIKVGSASQLAATGSMPAACFSSLATDTLLELDTAEPGLTITLSVKNTDTSAHDFGAVLYGVVLK